VLLAFGFRLLTLVVVGWQKKRLRVHGRFCSNVAVIDLTPSFSDVILENLLAPPVQGCVLKLYGVGNAPAKRKGLLEAVQRACNRGVVVVIISQCQRGGVSERLLCVGPAL
jgi:L-asparaginase/Glu-tRNA(Gln) amidotransferase subunit D